ncbi:MAG: LysM peptidoglycan-binding domain-containing protein [Bacillota bacterium]|jgi:hypothetical protein
MVETFFYLSRTLFLPKGSPPILNIEDLRIEVRNHKIVAEQEQLFCAGEVDILLDYTSHDKKHLSEGKPWQVLISVPFEVDSAGHSSCPPLCDLEIVDVEWFVVAANALELNLQLRLVPPPEEQPCPGQLEWEMRQKKVMKEELEENMKETVNGMHGDNLKEKETGQMPKSSKSVDKAWQIDSDKEETMEIVQKATVEEVAAEKAVVEETIIEKTVDKKAAAEEVIAEEQVAEKVAAEEMATKEIVAEEVVAEEVGAKEIEIKEVMAEEVMAEEIVAEEMAAVKTVAIVSEMPDDVSLAEQVLSEQAVENEQKGIMTATSSEEKTLSVDSKKIEEVISEAASKAEADSCLSEVQQQDKGNFCLRFYRVQPGEEGITIALRFGVSPEDLAAKNKINLQDIQSGMMLSIPS